MDRHFFHNNGMHSYSQFDSVLSPNSTISNDIVKENFPRIHNNSMSLSPNLPLMADDPGFAERAAKFSCFGSRSFNSRSDEFGLNSNKGEFPFGSIRNKNNNNNNNVSPVAKFPRVSSVPMLKIDGSPVGFEEKMNLDQINMKLSTFNGSAANSNEESSVSEQFPVKKDFSWRKRKGASNAKKEVEANDDSNSKRLKKPEQENGGKSEENAKLPEAPKDYIHVRARRGQATDSHSLAERVRREKISDRMKLLQNLVPNCNKVTGKALMLDEIINYVQSLQKQVEFLSMKLATVNPSLDFDTNDLLSQNANQQNASLLQPSTIYQQNTQVLYNASAPMTQTGHEFVEPFPQFSGFSQDDLHSIVRMGIGENLDLDNSFFQMTHDQASNMKIKL